MGCRTDPDSRTGPGKRKLEQVGANRDRVAGNLSEILSDPEIICRLNFFRFSQPKIFWFSVAGGCDGGCDEGWRVDRKPHFPEN